jgi:hypothetical protein
MFAFAAFAAVMPAHEDWLKDLSSTPPVSSTMQAFTDDSGVPAAAALDAGAAALDAGAAGALLAGAAALDAGAAGALDAATAGALADAGALELELDLLLLHAVSATATIPVAATTWIVLLTMPPLEFRCLSPGETDPRTIGAS